MIIFLIHNPMFLVFICISSFLLPPPPFSRSVVPFRCDLPAYPPSVGGVLLHICLGRACSSLYCCFFSSNARLPASLLAHSSPSRSPLFHVPFWSPPRRFSSPRTPFPACRVPLLCQYLLLRVCIYSEGAGGEWRKGRALVREGNGWVEVWEGEEEGGVRMWCGVEEGSS